MGNYFLTNFALYDGNIISTFEARALANSGNNLTGTLSCIDCGGQMKFVDEYEGKHEAYFAHVSSSDDVKVHSSTSGKKGEGYLHYLAKKLILSNELETLFLGGDIILRSDIVAIRAERAVYVYAKNGGKRKFIPDLHITTKKCDYYIEIYNKNKLSAVKKGYYRLLKEQSPEEFKVVEIQITDLNSYSSQTSFENIESMLSRRLSDFSIYSNVVSLESKKEVADYQKAPFGICDVCNKPLVIATNTRSNDFSSSVRSCQGISTTSLVDLEEFKHGDKTELGGAFVICPNCVENFKFQLQCPDCLKHGKFSTMKLLRNDKNGRIFLACSKYSSLSSEARTGIASGCNCTLTVYEKDGLSLADEILSVKGIVNWLKTGSGNKALKAVRKK